MDNTNSPLTGLLILIVYAVVWPFKIVRAGWHKVKGAK